MHQHSYSARTDFGEGYDRVTKLQYVKNTVSHKSSVPSTGSDNTRTIWDVWDTICITVISGCKTIFFRPIFWFRPLACREPPASSALQRQLCLPCRFAHEAAGDSALQPLSGLQVPLKSSAASPRDACHMPPPSPVAAPAMPLPGARQNWPRHRRIPRCRR